MPLLFLRTVILCKIFSVRITKNRKREEHFGNEMRKREFLPKMKPIGTIGHIDTCTYTCS